MIKKIVICSLALAACAIALLWFYWPQPLIRDSSNAKIAISIFVGDPDAHSGELMSIKDFPEAEILNYLKTCSVRRCLFPERPNDHDLYDTKIDIIVISGKGDKCHTHITLANVNYIDKGGLIKYKILNVKPVTETLLKMIDYDKYNAEYNSNNQG